MPDMPDQDTDFELSKIEKIIRFLSLFLLITTILLTSFFQQGRNLIVLIFPIFIYYLIYLPDDTGRKPGRFFKLGRFLLANLCLLIILKHFLNTYFELSLNMEFVKVKGTQVMNHPIANMLVRWELVLGLITFFTFPLMTTSTENDVEL
jgi:hypothetical protein